MHSPWRATTGLGVCPDTDICPASQIVAAAIAQCTTTIRIGTGIVLLSHHGPLRLAEDYALVDVLSSLLLAPFSQDCAGTPHATAW